MTSGEGWEARWGLTGGAAFPAEDQILLVATPREWFRSALEAVLQPEGFTVLWAHDSREVLDFVEVGSPDLLIVDETIGPMEAPALCRALKDGPLSPAVPVVLYASDMTTERLQSRVLQAGAWEVIREPIRAEYLLAALRRLLHIGRQVAGAAEAGSREGVEPGTCLLTFPTLARLLPKAEALAERAGISVSCAVVGPTSRGSGEALERQRDVAERLCSSHLRRADLCGWVKRGDMAIVAFDADSHGAEILVRRLESVSTELIGAADGEETARPVLSAGIVELSPPPGATRGESGAREEEAVESRAATSLEAARHALEDAREEGGGIKVAEPESP